MTSSAILSRWYLVVLAAADWEVAEASAAEYAAAEAVEGDDGGEDASAEREAEGGAGGAPLRKGTG